jgi:hypothetical protein
MQAYASTYVLYTLKLQLVRLTTVGLTTAKIKSFISLMRGFFALLEITYIWIYMV